MISEIATGKIPWYGVFGNDVKSIHNTIERYKIDEDGNKTSEGIDDSFVYIPEWTVRLGGDDLHIIVRENGIKFYTSNIDKMIAYNRRVEVSDEDDTICDSEKMYENNIYKIRIPILRNTNTYNIETYNVYLKDTEDMLFIRYEGIGCCAETIITNDGYIQHKRTNYGVFTNCMYSFIPYVVEQLDTDETCENCSYYTSCKKASSTRTSCYYNITSIDYKKLNDWEPNVYNGSSVNFLFKPSSDSYNYTCSRNEYISNIDLNTSEGEVFINGAKHDYNIKRVMPLYNNASDDSDVLSLNVKVNDSNKYIYLKKNLSINSYDNNYKDAMLNVSYNNEIYSNFYNRTTAINIESMSAPNAMNYKQIVAYGYGDPDSSYRNAFSCHSVVFNTKINVSSITLVISGDDSNFGYDDIDTLPNDISHKYRIFYSSSTSVKDELHQNTANCKYVDFKLSQPYKKNQFITIPINGYVKQIAVVPRVSSSEQDELNGNRWYYNIIDYMIIRYKNASTDSYTYSK